MMIRLVAICCVLALATCFSSALEAQEKRLEKLQTGGGSASATQMSLWLAKEGNYYQKHGLNVEVISIPGSSLALQAMLSGELPIIQAGGAGPIQTSLSGADTVIIATIAKKFNWWIFSQPNITRMEDLKGKVFGTTRFGTQSDLASRIALRRYGIDPERDITMVQTGGPAETVSAMMTGKVHAAAITPPATLQAKKVKLRELLDLSKLDVEYHVNGLVTTRRFIKSNEDVVRRFLMAYIEGAARGQKDKPFAIKTMAKYFRSDDRELLEETYELIIKDGFSLPPYPAGVANLLQGLEAQYPKAKGAKPEDFVDSHFVRELEQNGFIKSVLAAK
jgi:NitT/TauT family transport system substrate-binding protein